MKKGILGCNIIYLFILICIGIALPIKSQNNYKVKLTGTVYEYDHNNKRLPLEFAAVSIPEIALGTTSDENGRYILENVPTGKIRMQIQYLGKVSIDTLINVNKDLVLNFTMRNEDFKLKEVTVTATNSRSGKSTSSHISRSAMDHMQATSLYDVIRDAGNPQEVRVVMAEALGWFTNSVQRPHILEEIKKMQQTANLPEDLKAELEQTIKRLSL